MDLGVKLRSIPAALAFAAFVAAYSGAAEFGERWVYIAANLASDEGVAAAIEIIDEAHRAGCTHVLLADNRFNTLERMPAEYRVHCRRVKIAADLKGLKIIPAIFSIGWSGGLLKHDPNLAAGLPVVDAPFVVKDGKALPASYGRFPLTNGDFEQAEGDRFKGWAFQDFVSKRTFRDTEVKHSGGSSLKMIGLESPPPELAGVCRIMQRVNVKPFRYYKFSVWIKTENLQSTGTQVLMLSGEKGYRGRGNCYTHLRVKPSQDWTRHEVVFNTLDGSEIRIYLVSRIDRGTIWWDDIEVAPAGLTNILRRELTPLKVTNEAGTVTYVEGKDFLPVRDPNLGFYRKTNSDLPIVLTPRSRIREGQRLLVSYYHPIVTYRSQVCISVSDPAVFDIMDDQMRRMHDLWRAPGYFMSYDEMRAGGWEKQPGGAEHTPGELLAAHVDRAVGIIRKHAPDADIYVWSDMFDPNHNARPAEEHGPYYHVNGDWYGSWEGLPTEVIVMNWNHTDKCRESLRFFADRGYRQLIAAYYDGDPRADVAAWLGAADGIPGIGGIMYTTWKKKYADLHEFFRLVDEYPAWVETDEAEALSEK